MDEEQLGITVPQTADGGGQHGHTTQPEPAGQPYNNYRNNMSPKGSRSSGAQRKRKGEATVRPAQRSRLASEKLRDSPKAKLTLLSLSDEALSVIFSHLTRTNNGTVIREPHNAISLAKVHPRLLRVFASLLTHVATDEYCFLPPQYVLLDPQFFIEIVNSGAGALRELQIAPLPCGKLKDLARLCPRLESVSVDFSDDCEGGLDTLRNILSLRLRTLSITYPSESILGLIETPPPELCIFGVSTCSEELKRILDCTSRKIQLEFYTSSHSVHLESLVRLMPHLSDLCSRAEAVSLILAGTVVDFHFRDLTYPGAMQHLASVRKNSDRSLCKSISLSGDILFGLLRHVHPQACIDLTSGDATFIKQADGIYAKKLPLLTSYLGVDVSRLEEVLISPTCDTEWKNVLFGKRVARGEVRSVWVASILNLHMDVVTIEWRYIEGKNWGWLSFARELHIIAPPPRKRADIRLLTEGLPHLIDSLNECTVCVHGMSYSQYRLFIPPDAGGESDNWDAIHPHEPCTEAWKRARRRGGLEKVKRGWKASLEAVKRFEGRGGNGMVFRDLLEGIRDFVSKKYDKDCAPEDST